MSEDQAIAVSLISAYHILYPKLYMLALAVQGYEGYRPDTLAWRNYNPGNLRGLNGKFRVFATYHEGFLALVEDLFIKCSGRSRTGLKHTSSLLDLMRVYAPASDMNDPDKYATYVARRLGYGDPKHVELQKIIGWVD